LRSNAELRIGLVLTRRLIFTHGARRVSALGHHPSRPE
jgi:hypothetical protein